MRQCSALLLLLLLCCSLRPAQSNAEQQKIPRLIHRSYMAGAAALQAATVGPQPDFRAHWLASCTVSAALLRLLVPCRASGALSSTTLGLFLACNGVQLYSHELRPHSLAPSLSTTSAKQLGCQTTLWADLSSSYIFICTRRRRTQVGKK
jgi:hypothetical protein